MMRRVYAPAMAGLLALAGLAGCGGSDPGACDGNKTGTFVTNDQLCKLTCSSTTRDQAIAALGQPDASFGTTSLTYNYLCARGSGGDALLISLEFDATSGVLTRVSRMGMGAYASGTLPSCLDACSAK